MICTPLVRHGEDERLSADRETERPEHTFVPVHREMLYTIAVEYSGLPDLRTLTASQIRFFYEGLRPMLKRSTKPGTTPSPRLPSVPRRKRF